MKPKHSLVLALLLAATLGAAGAPASGGEEGSVPLTLAAGRPLRVALDQKIRLRHVGQPVTATLVEDVYARDRVVLPAGTHVLGRVERLDKPSKGAHWRAIAGGDFTPLRKAVLKFDTLTWGDGRQLTIDTTVDGGYENVALLTAKGSDKETAVDKVKEEAGRRVQEELAPLKGPGKLERLKDGFIRHLPYHPQYLRKGTLYTARLTAPVPFGTVTPIARAEGVAVAPPGSVLKARLTSSLDSATSAQGTRVHGVLTQPVFAGDGRLLLPEGTEIEGEVTFSRGARHLRRNGQLRFLFETVRLPGEDPEAMKASLQGAELGRGQRVAIDEEGGATVTNSKARFVLPAVALLSLRSSLESEAPDPGEVGGGGGGSDILSQGPGGFLAWSLLGVGLSQISKPVAAVFGVVGVVRSTYRSFFAKGREVVIPADTAIQLQLAPAPTGP
jgi:hypothetical protein